MASNNSQPTASMGGASAPSKGKSKASSSKVRKMVDRAVYRKAKWRLSEIASDVEDDESNPQAEALTEGDMSSVELKPSTCNFRATSDPNYCILLWRVMWDGQAPPSSARSLGLDKQPTIQLHRLMGKHGWLALKRDSKYHGRVCKGSPKLPSKWYCSYFFIRLRHGTWHAPTGAPLSTLWSEGSDEEWAKDFSLGKYEREQKHHILRAPPLDFARKGERARVLGELYDHDFDCSSLVRMTKKAPGTSRVGPQKAPSASAGHVLRSFDQAPAATEEASSPHLFPPLNPREPLPEKSLGKRPASTISPAEMQKKKKRIGLGSIDEFLAPPRSRRVVKPKELVPISPSAALNAPSAFTSATELRNFLKLPLDEGASPAGSACQHLFHAMLDVVALSDKSLENRERAHKNYLLASQLKTSKATLQGVNSHLGDELSLVKQQLSDALAAESVSAREEMEKELALQ
ncbi:unnamed protein product [Linum trigynum]|uniref:Uncharacterized protein n=1 Tax=Linum trigynum TaxID=586398 RepID=A0AAV2FNY2_9ROSI